MSQHKGQLWEVGLRDGTPVWLLEWEVKRHLPRRVLLAVDTSDSCAHERGHLKALFSALADSLEVGDGCAMWIIGRREKVLEEVIGHSQDRLELARKLDRSLAPEMGGTWLRETLGAMLAQAERSDPTSTSIFLLLATDGEVFDVEALPSRANWPLGFVRLGERTSRQLEMLALKCVPLTASVPALKSFLVNPPATVTFDHGQRGSRLVVFSKHGDIVGELPTDGLVSVENEQQAVLVAYVGGDRPEPQLRYQVGERAWRATGIECAALPTQQPPHLRRLLRALEGHQVEWDYERLTLLAGDHEKKEEFDCPKCHRSRRARKSLFCYCDALLVSRDKIEKSEVQELYPGTICFLYDGETVHGPPTQCRLSTGSDAYDVHEDQGRLWLVLNLYK